MTIPKPESKPPEDSIPATAAELPQPEEAPEGKSFLISFERYNSSECELDGMDNKRARKALQIVRDVGVNIKAEEDFKRLLPKLDVCSINNSGDYRGLYKGLVDLPDAEIKEAKIDRDKGRLFFFVVGRIFHVIAMRDSHYETGKQRR